MAYSCILFRQRLPNLVFNKIKYFLPSSNHCIRKKHENRNMLRLHERGMIENMFPENASQEILDLFNRDTQCVYAGFDPTANSLHVGHLVIIMHLLHWQRAGHRVIAVVGRATANIGDPSGKTSDREQLDWSDVKRQGKQIGKNIHTIFANHQNHIWRHIEDADPLQPLLVVNNYDWYKKMNVIQFISSIGRSFRLGRMLSKENISKRLEDRGINFNEFCYQIFQAYDWLHLFKKYDCYFQVGGNDQMGNIVSGHNLISKTEKKHVYAFTLPLITTEGGDKFGKSVSNAVWLDGDLTSPFELYQFFMRIPDHNVERFLKFFTFDSVPSIAHLMKQHMKNPENRIAQKKLAEDVTLLVHGKEGLSSAKQATSVLYNKNLEALNKISASDAAKIFEGATMTDLFLKPGYTVLQMALDAKCFLDEVDGRRIIEAGGFYINYERVLNADEVLVQSIHILSNNMTLLRVGKRNYWVVKWI